MLGSVAGPAAYIQSTRETSQGWTCWGGETDLISGIFFILSLRGLSSPETSRTGNIFGMTGMLIAITSTLLGLESFEILLSNIEFIIRNCTQGHYSG